MTLQRNKFVCGCYQVPSRELGSQSTFHPRCFSFHDQARCQGQPEMMLELSLIASASKLIRLLVLYPMPYKSGRYFTTSTYASPSRCISLEHAESFILPPIYMCL